MNDEFLKKLEALEQRMSELEAQLKKNLLMFGRSYSLVGDSNSDFLIKTRGLIKIQWGSKFIDLIKDGKINIDSKFIYDTSTIGSKDGIYVIGDNEVWLVSNGNSINLLGEIGDTYVSFLDFLETTSDLKYQALTNIGFIYPSIDSISESSLLNGIIYIESEKKLYTIINGNLEEFSINFPNLFSKSFIISKSDDSLGALIIKGLGIENSLAFDGLYFYKEENESIIKSDSDISVKIGNENILIISDSKAEFLNKVVSSSFESTLSSATNGFRLYTLNGISILEIDKIIVRQPSDNIPVLYPKDWYCEKNVIKDISTSDESYIISLNLEGVFEIGDTLITYLSDTSLEDIITLIPVTFTIIDIQSTDEVITSIIVNSEYENLSTLLDDLIGSVIYKISNSESTYSPIIVNKNLIEVNNTKIGDLSNIDENIKGYGIYTDNLNLGGNSEDNLPKYSDSLLNILENIDIDSLNYDKVLCTIGILRLINLDLKNRVLKLELEIEKLSNT